MSSVEEMLLLQIGVVDMKVSAWIGPGMWGAVGWRGGDGDCRLLANGLAWDRVDSTAVAVLVPYCVADAERDPDLAKLAKLKAEQSSYGRAQLVSDGGWATRPGRTTPDRRLASECSDKLRVTHIPPWGEGRSAQALQFQQIMHEQGSRSAAFAG